VKVIKPGAMSNLWSEGLSVMREGASVMREDASVMREGASVTRESASVMRVRDMFHCTGGGSESTDIMKCWN